jgi:peptidyl-prolyl cis-trans isomerase D
MLRYLRENTGNWIIKFFLGIIVLVFVFLGVGSMNASKVTEVATVNDAPITLKEFQQAHKNMVQRMRQQFGDAMNADLLKALNLKQQAVNSLIDQKLMELEADKLEVIVSDQELQDSLLGIKAFQRDGQFDMDLYAMVLGRNGMTPETFEASQRQALKENKLRKMVMDSITVTDAEASTWYTFQNTKKAVNYIEINPDTFTGLEPGAEAVKKQYQANKDKYRSKPKRQVAYLRFSPADYAGQVGVTDEQILAYYEQHADTYKIPEKVAASHVLIRVDENADEAAVAAAEKEAMAVYEKAKKGEAFDALAKEFSQGPSGPSGGALGTFEKDAMVKPFAEAAFSMAAGEISKPVKTRFGWHVIKVGNRFPAKVVSLAEARADIRKELEKEELNNLAYYKAGEAFDAVIDGDDFEQVALIAKKQIQQTPAFSADGQGLGMDNAQAFAKEAFTLSDKGISDVMQLGDDYYLIQLKKTIDPKQLPLEAVETDIIVSLTAAKQHEAAEKKAQELLKKAESQGDLSALAKDNALEIKTSDAFTRSQAVKGIAGSGPITAAAFTLDKAGKVYPEVIEAGGRYYLISLSDVQVPTDKEIQAGLKDVKAQVASKKQQQHFYAWMTALKEKADISINTQIIN